MTGSSLVPIIVPIVALIALAVWLGMVYYADRHPQHGHSSGAGQSAAGPAAQEGGLAAPQQEEGLAEPAQPAAVPGPRDVAGRGSRARGTRSRPHRRASRGKIQAGHGSR